MYGNGGQVKVWLNEYEERGILVIIYLLFGYIKLYIIVSYVMFGWYVISIRIEILGVFILLGVMVGLIYK